jgi:hypothetical protein
MSGDNVARERVEGQAVEPRRVCRLATVSDPLSEIGGGINLE